MEREGGLDGNVLNMLEKESVSNGSVLSSSGKGRGFRWQCTKYTAKGGCEMAMY